MGIELYRSCKLPVPLWKPLLITDAFLNRNPSCWIETPTERLRPNSGLCFGSLYLGDNNSSVLEFLPGTAFSRIHNRKNFWLAWLIDACVEHCDNRQALFLKDDTGVNAVFIDHGHMFGGPKKGKETQCLAARYLDSRIYPAISLAEQTKLRRIVATLDVDQLWQKVNGLPHNWKTASALKEFETCLDKLSTKEFVRYVFDTIMELQQTSRYEFSESQFGRQFPQSLFCASVSVAESYRDKPSSYRSCV
jgi:hypothetical protein